jgi:hypothetical protein
MRRNVEKPWPRWLNGSAANNAPVTLMNTVHNARATLTATIINNLAAAFAVAGFVAPAASGLLDSAGRFAVAVAWSGISVGLHFLARAILEGVNQ